MVGAAEHFKGSWPRGTIGIESDVAGVERVARPGAPGVYRDPGLTHAQRAIFLVSWSSGMSVLVDEFAEGVGAEHSAGVRVVHYGGELVV